MKKWIWAVRIEGHHLYLVAAESTTRAMEIVLSDLLDSSENAPTITIERLVEAYMVFGLKADDIDIEKHG